jgi:hypothetical protein
VCRHSRAPTYRGLLISRFVLSTQRSRSDRCSSCGTPSIPPPRRPPPLTGVSLWRRSLRDRAPACSRPTTGDADLLAARALCLKAALVLRDPLRSCGQPSRTPCLCVVSGSPIPIAPANNETPPRTETWLIADGWPIASWAMILFSGRSPGGRTGPGPARLRIKDEEATVGFGGSPQGR